MRSGLRWLGIAMALVILVLIGIAIAYDRQHAERIFPGVTVNGLDVGGMTLPEAETALQRDLPDPQIEGVTVRAADQTWRFSWAALGQRYDIPATIAEAFEVAREEAWLERLQAAWRVRQKGQDIPVIAISADPAKATLAMETIAKAVFRAPVDANLSIGPEGATGTPGQPGQELDVTASSTALLDTLQRGETELNLQLRTIPPHLETPEPAYSRAVALLAAPFTLEVNDPVTDFRDDFEAPPAQIAEWLSWHTESDPPAIILDIRAEPIRAWLEDVTLQLGAERHLDTSETLTRTLSALDREEHRAMARVRHPEKTYIVQPNDNMFDIAYSFGFPLWRLIESNPDVISRSLLIGQQLVIPSIDVLISEPVVLDKRIEINLPQQSLRAYQDGELHFEFTVSSGMSKTPTIAGLFQILTKEESAFAERWSLDMPYFMGIYKEGPEFYNGIHELPITRGGYRLSRGVLGWPGSFGCIILDVGDAQRLFEWAPIGTLVAIKGVAPGTPTWQETLDQIVDSPP
ncbi:MAG: peptidoglycan binding domain-containing protein [Anaerolineae bacterium]|nr:peptidoglycan binding domain-containing protein [Anaerolineae bacterium]